MATGSRRQAGTSDPLDFRSARTVGSGRDEDFLLYGGNLATNDPSSRYTLVGGAIKAQVAIAGALQVRLRGLFTGAGGTLSFLYLRPASARAAAGQPGYTYAAGAAPAHVDVVVVADTEFVIDINPGGESDLLVTFTPAGTGHPVFFDVMQQ